MKPNIIFLVIDSLRSDKFHGKTKSSVTPNIDSLIENGSFFPQSIASAPTTIPSVSSIITSLYPFECMIKDGDFFTLNPNIETFLSDFKNNGYTLYANNPKLISYLQLNGLFQPITTQYEFSKILNKKLGDTLMDELESKKLKEPWLYYLHVYDLHEAESLEIRKYDDEIFQNKIYGDTVYERIISSIDTWLGKILERIDLTETLLILTADHGTEIGNYNREMELFYEKLKNKEQDTLFFKTGQKFTHFLPSPLLPIRKKLASIYLQKKNNELKRTDLESIEIEKQCLGAYQKRIMRHAIESISNVYDDRLKVPLLFVGPQIPKKIITQQVRSVDIFPTLSELIGLPSKKNIRGTSLLPIMKGLEIEEKPAFIESAVNVTKMKTMHVIGVRTSNYKYFRDRNFPTENLHLFNLDYDPYEENNVAASNVEIIRQMELFLKELRGSHGFNYIELPNIINENNFTDTIDIFKELGYIK